MSEAEIGSREAHDVEEKAQEEETSRYVMGVDPAVGDDVGVTAIRNLETGGVQFMKHRSVGMSTYEAHPSQADNIAKLVEKETGRDLSDKKFETFSVEAISRIAKYGKTSILVLSTNKKESERRARLLYAVLARLIARPYYGRVEMKNGTVIKFIEDYDQLGSFEPEHVYE